jgi:phosphoribosylformimino-5-aminoimidazole carboxamide ribotide isomerase
MMIIPAIDVLEGRCVRLKQGDYERSTTYDASPEEVARRHEAAGARWIHVVDLDAARSQGDNRRTIALIRKAVRSHIEVGGGVRSEDDIETLLSLGIDRVVLGTVLVREPERVQSWFRRFGEHLVAGVDALQGQVKISGWEQQAGLADEELVRRVAAQGFPRMIYTSIGVDGTLAGPDVAATERVAEASGMATILSGGISCDDDVATVADRAHRLIKGVITGKALYEGRIDLRGLIDRFQKGDEW